MPRTHLPTPSVACNHARVLAAWRCKSLGSPLRKHPRHRPFVCSVRAVADQPFCPPNAAHIGTVCSRAGGHVPGNFRVHRPRVLHCSPAATAVHGHRWGELRVALMPRCKYPSMSGWPSPSVTLRSPRRKSSAQRRRPRWANNDRCRSLPSLSSLLSSHSVA